MQLAMDKGHGVTERFMGDDERLCCESRGEMNIIGDIDIDFMVIGA